MIGFVLVICVTAIGHLGGEEFAIADVAKGLKVRDDSLKSCTITMRIQITQSSPLTGVIHNYAAANEVRLDRVLGRFHSHLHGASLMPPAPFKDNKEYLAEIDQINAYDGERTRNYSRFPGYDAAGKDTGRFIEVGRVYPKLQQSWVVNPENLIGSHSGVDLIEVFKEYEWHVDGRDGDLIIAQATKRHEPDDADKTDYRTRIWFDVRKGMAPARGQSLKLSDGAKDWATLWEFSSDDWSEVRPGLWLPGKHQEDSWSVQPGGPAKLERRLIVEAAYSDINRDFDAGTFKLKFPPGIQVVDSERGTHYQSAAITDKTLDDDARKSLELRSLYEAQRASLSSSSEKTWQPWAWGAAAIVVVAFCVVIYRAKAARRHQSRVPQDV